MELKNVKNMLQTKWWSIVIKVTPNLKFVLVEQDGVGENQETFCLRNTVGCSKWSSKVQGQARERPTKCERWGMISGRGLVVSVVCRSGLGEEKGVSQLPTYPSYLYVDYNTSEWQVFVKVKFLSKDEALSSLGIQK